MPFVPDASLAYDAIRWHPAPGEGLEMDAAYRTAHLPLIAPAHPDVIPRSGDGLYHMGRYECAHYSLVLPVPASLLEASPAFRALDAKMASASFAGKIAREAMARRREFLHATLCGGLREDQVEETARVLKAFKKQHGVFPAYRLSGPLVGAKNRGRIYFPLHPESGNGENALHLIQDAVSRPRTTMFLTGYYHLKDHLTPPEAAKLGSLLQEFERKTLLETKPDQVWIIVTHDDLLLSGKVARAI